jgi:uridylate kinase
MKSKRVILKLSGESFSNNAVHLDFDRYEKVADELINIRKKTGVQLAIVVGGGNIFRGKAANSKVDPAEADFMGMMATTINGIGLREALIRKGEKKVKLMSALGKSEIAEKYSFREGNEFLKNDGILIIVGGLGRPRFTTDSAVAQYADELNCEIVLKASTVDGVYDKDPRKYNDAKRYKEVGYNEALEKKLGIMDAAAFAICMRANIPIFVFDVKDVARVSDAIKGNYSFGTLISAI